MKFRKKPVIVDALQFFVKAPDGWPADVYEDCGVCFVRTLEGDMQVCDGDWIITGVKGERYPCKPDIFELTYERADQL